MFPLRDDIQSESFPIVTIFIIILNSFMWMYEISLGPRLENFLWQYGLVPLHVVAYDHFRGGFIGNALIPMFTSIFMHGGWMHIIGNMWFLWIFGDNIEGRLGHFKFFLFYLLCGIGASVIHVISNPESRIPTIGASGAISGVLGAYLISFPHARVLTLFIIVIIIRIIEIPAFAFLIFWFVFQFLSSASQASMQQDAGGVAYWAHMGGFVVGIVLLLLFPKKPSPQPHSRYSVLGRR
jgi:membrane associated rhomboid family serine protease